MARTYISRDTGTALTPDLIEALAAEAEAGYDLSDATIVRTGRPALQKGAPASPRVSFRAPRALEKAARARAAAEGRSLSALARDALQARILRGGHVPADVELVRDHLHLEGKLRQT